MVNTLKPFVTVHVFGTAVQTADGPRVGEVFKSVKTAGQVRVRLPPELLNWRMGTVTSSMKLSYVTPAGMPLSNPPCMMPTCIGNPAKLVTEKPMALGVGFHGSVGFILW